MASTEIDALTQALARLPGLGPRSARRAVLHLMKKRETAMVPLLRALERVNERQTVCSICGNVDTTDPCGICADPRRDTRLLCVVEEVSALRSEERRGGQECVSTCRARWASSHSKKHNTTNTAH